MKGAPKKRPASSSVRTRASQAPRSPSRAIREPIAVERVQTGLRIEKRILKVLKAMAEVHDMTLGDLVEGIVLHAFDGRSAFGAQSLARIRTLKEVYQLDLDSRASHRLVERD
jgi:predicted DNA-binding ribbon-helix-helix protein